MKKIVANMTMGNDMSPLFPDVLSCMQVPVLEVKKMVYLYLVNYAKTKPDMAIMAVNSFVKVGLHEYYFFPWFGKIYTHTPQIVRMYPIPTLSFALSRFEQ